MVNRTSTTDTATEMDMLDDPPATGTMEQYVTVLQRLQASFSSNVLLAVVLQ